MAVTATLHGAVGIERGIEVFVRGFAFTRGFTHPCEVLRVGGVWVVRDGPRRRAGDYRREEWIARGGDAVGVDRAARAGARGRYTVCAVRTPEESFEEMRDAYKALGYRLKCTEPLMAHGLRRIPRVAEPFPVRRVMTKELADALAKAARARQILPEHLCDDAPLRQYAALDGGRPVGWVKSITVGDAAWVSNMYVRAEYRRRGIGRSLLAAMLRDDKKHGMRASVLTASHTGAMLYGSVGCYEQVGELLVLNRVR